MVETSGWANGATAFAKPHEFLERAFYPIEGASAKTLSAQRLHWSSAAGHGIEPGYPL
ncbi:hypothetical protein [Oceanicaulis sp.]|jgi:hypothetical protein|uniref:hypothetical protein n=1 Tax=Oceanicaulis sp. TaxID=1924941 RepID=UPI0025F965E4|nr:hypothetical protein [Oceanicaulis sp.]|tara:strand:- start:316 stop:489 length:174 start_codon:yes stop_codon:yes gene_type:complete